MHFINSLSYVGEDEDVDNDDEISNNNTISKYTVNI